MTRKRSLYALLAFLAMLAATASVRPSVNAARTRSTPSLRTSKAVASPVLPYTAKPLDAGVENRSAAVSALPAAVLYGDVDGDGQPDFIELANGMLSLRRGAGDGKFASPETVVESTTGTRLAVADVNGDGRKELALLVLSTGMVEVYGVEPNGVELKKWEADTRPLSRLSVHPALQSAGAMAAGDLDRDGYDDVVVASDTGVLVLRGGATGLSGTTYLDIATGGRISDLAVDVRTGRIFAADEMGQQILVWHLTDNAVVSDGSIPVGVSVTALLAADLDRDGAIDLAGVSREGLLVKLLGDKRGGFETPTLHPALAGGTHLDVVEMNCDAVADLLTSDAAGRMAVLLGSPDGDYSAPQFLVAADGVVAWATARLTVDAMTDVVAISRNGSEIITNQQPTTFTVTNLNDTGDGSLRAAITGARNQRPSVVAFNIPLSQATQTPFGTVFIITPATPLPLLDTGGITIDGSTQGIVNPNGPQIYINAAGPATSDTVPAIFDIQSANNVIRRIGFLNSARNHIRIRGVGVAVTANTVEGCYIGVTADGLSTAPAAQVGVLVTNGAQNNVIGGTTAATQNIISSTGATGAGIVIEGAGTTGNVARGNLVSVARGGNGLLQGTPGPGNGIIVRAGAINTTIGGESLATEGNTVAGNVGGGVAGRSDIIVTGSGTINTLVRANLLGTGTPRSNLSTGGSTVRITDNASLTTVRNNVIAFDAGNGISVGATASEVGTQFSRLTQNQYFGTANATSLAIDLGSDGPTANGALPRSGPNGLLNTPVISSVVQNGANLVATGSVVTASPTTAQIEFYAEFPAVTGMNPVPPRRDGVFAIVPQADGTFTATFPAPTGTFNVSAIQIDAQGNTSEFSAAVGVTALPDLIVQNLTVAPGSVLSGENVTVTFVVRNQGTANAGATTSGIFLSADNVIDATDTQLTVVATPAINANAATPNLTTTVTIPAGTPAGARFIGVIADLGQTLTGENRTNNTASTALTINAPRPDLAVGAFTLSTSNGAPGGQVTINLTVLNQGRAAAPASVTEIRLLTTPTVGQTGVLLNSTNLGPIAPNLSIPLPITVTIPTTVPPGNYFIGVILDAAATVDDADRTNNTSSSPFQVVAAASVIVDALSVAPTSVDPGGNVTVTFSIRNQGGSPTPSLNHDVVFSNTATIDRTTPLLVSRQTGPIAPGAAQQVVVTVTVPQNAAPGNRFIGVIADSGNVLASTNSTRTTPLAITDRIAPTATLVRPNGAEIIPAGRPFAIQWTAADNVGVAFQELRLSTDGGTSFGTVIATNIAPGTVTFNWTPPGTLNTTTGRVQLIVRDAAGNETTTASAANFTVGPQPLILTLKLKAGGALIVTGANIVAGARLRVIGTGGAADETFPLEITDRIRIRNSVTGTPGGRTISQVLPRGQARQVVIISPSGVTSEPFAFTPPVLQQ